MRLCSTLHHVSIHASSREDATLICILFAKPFHVSIHASSREDATHRTNTFQFHVSFNPRVLAGGRDTSHPDNHHTTPRFNPRVLAGGRDASVTLIQFLDLVSIHASSREDATCLHSSACKTISFNPRVLAGGRDHKRNNRSSQTTVSIHASSREDATVESPGFSCSPLFQSTRPRGRTRRAYNHVRNSPV